MGQLLRSRDMSLVHLYVQMEAVHDVLTELGILGLVQFQDLNPEVSSFQRNFVHEIKKLEEMERRLTFMQGVLKKQDEAYLPHVFPVESLIPSMDQLDAELDDLEREVKSLEDNHVRLDRNLYELTEMHELLVHVESVFEAELPKNNADDKQANVGFIVGTVPKTYLNFFEKVLWRTTRGNMYLRTVDLETLMVDPQSGVATHKYAFVIFFQGEVLSNKLRKVCDAFNCNTYPCPETVAERSELVSEVNNRILDLNRAISITMQHKVEVLKTLQRNMEFWKSYVMKEKAIYHTMNMFEYDPGRKCLIAEGWCPTENIDEIQEAIRIGNDRAGSMVPAILSIVESQDVPPTYHKTNDFTAMFQEIVDMYGIARYKEINPGPFTIITFPFLFGVMFGDIGHGLILLLCALAITFHWRFNKDPVKGTLKSVYAAKYLLLFMALFAIYCGFMYNEFFALPVSIFPVNWRYPTPYYQGEYADQIDPGYVYPFGVDPMWKGTANELDYYNSLKMKMSVIFGVTQMSFGIFLSLLNAIHFRKPLDIIFGFIPQILFLQCIFGYLVFLIFLKWIISADVRLLGLLIDMILYPWRLDPQYYMYPGQHFVQVVLLVVAVVSVPCMLFPKPIILFIMSKRKKTVMIVDELNEIPMTELDEDHKAIEVTPDAHGGGHHGGEFDFSEEFIHQAIHTIEFVLGCISNTASYLRLWALSLAHAELSLVFYERVFLAIGIDSSNWFLIFFTWGVWAGLTLGVLMGMESLSAFLHALRLHWVEFQNKFYAADGHKFMPLSFQRLQDEEDDESM